MLNAAVTVFLVALSGLLAPMLFAAQAEPPMLTLEQAVTIALEGNHRLGASDAAVGAAEAGVDEARSARRPRAELLETFSRTTNPVFVFGNLLGQEAFGPDNFDPAFLNEPPALSNFNTQVVVSYPLYTGGRVRSAIEAARHTHEAASDDRERTRQEVVRQVVDAFTGAVVSVSHLRVARDALRTARANVQLVSDLREAGLVVESDLLQARVRESEVEEMVIRAESAVEIARAAVNLVLGRDLETPFSLPEKIEPSEDRRGSVERLVEEALANRPDLRAADRRVLRAEQAITAARSGYFPEVGLHGRYETNADEFAGADGSNWSMMVAARFSLYEGGGTRARVVRAEQNARRAERMREMQRQAAALETHRAFHEVQASRKSLEQSRRAVALAEDSLRIVRDRYREGLTTLVELLDAEDALTRARTREVATTRDLVVNGANLKLAVGEL